MTLTEAEPIKVINKNTCMVVLVGRLKHLSSEANLKIANLVVLAIDGGKMVNDGKIKINMPEKLIGSSRKVSFATKGYGIWKEKIASSFNAHIFFSITSLYSIQIGLLSKTMPLPMRFY